jgi:gluconolactonase
VVASVSDLYVIAAGLDHPEGVAMGPDGTLWAGGEAGQVYRIDREAGSAAEVANTGGFVLGIAHDATGRLYVCDAGRRAILRVEPRSGEIEVWCDSAGGGALETPNHLAFAEDGTLYFSDSGTESLDVRNGRMIRVPPGGGAGEVLELGTLHYTNGVCVTGDGSVHFLETLTPRLSTIVAGRAQVIAELPGTTPDGLAACADGGFIVSCYYPFHLLRVPAEGGAAEIVLDDPTGIHMPTPTNVAFYGAGLHHIAIASLGGQAVTGIDLGIAGAGVNYPDIP